MSERKCYIVSVIVSLRWRAVSCTMQIAHAWLFTCYDSAANMFCTLILLRGPPPKKQPMIPGSKIESADFYLSSRGYRILFKNEFLLFQFCFKPKISSHKLFPSDSSKIRPKVRPCKKNSSEITIATQNNKKKLHSVEEESL